MKRILFGLLALGFAGCQPNAEKAPDLKDDKDKLSYVIGKDMAQNFKRQSIEINPNVFAYAVRSTLAGDKALMTDEEIRQTMVAFQKKMMEKQTEAMQKHMADMQVQGQKNKQESEAYFAENKKKDGVKTTPSGLQYKVITNGNGPVPKATDVIQANYRGTLLNGTEFDSSYSRGQPATFPVSGVIPGWTEALKMMKVGSKWQLFIPPQLGYGERGAGNVIGPNAGLIFEIELLGIKK